MENILDVIYFEWVNKMQDTEEVKEAFEKLNEYDDVLKQVLDDDNYYCHGDAVMDVASTSQKQGFMAGFEIARQLLTGGNNERATNI